MTETTPIELTTDDGPITVFAPHIASISARKNEAGDVPAHVLVTLSTGEKIRAINPLFTDDNIESAYAWVVNCALGNSDAAAQIAKSEGWDSV